MTGLRWIFDAQNNISPALAEVTKGFDKLKEHTKGTEASIKGAYSNMGNAVKGFERANMEAFSAIQAQVPGLGGTLELLTNPYVAVAAASAAAIGVMYKGVEAAGEFENSFLNLKDLNLEKGNAQLKELKDNILDLSLKTGLGAKELATGYFDIESLTGKYGKEVEGIIGYVGEFAESTGADVNLAIAGAGKAMKNFQGLSKEEYIASGFAAFKSAKVDFNEFAQVQADYLGAVSGAYQTLDSGNKVFALMSAGTKDAREAATSTKMAFLGLSDPKVVEGLEGLKKGLVFDKQGNVRPLDQTLGDLIKITKELTPKQVLQLKGAIGGNEGLMHLLSEASKNGDELLRTFASFDEAKKSFDYAKVIDEGNKNLDVMKKKLGQEVNTTLIILGEAILPYVVKGLGFINEKVSSLVGWFRETYKHSAMFRDVLSVIGDVGKAAFHLLLFPIERMINLFHLGYDLVSGLGTAFGITGSDVGRAYETIRPVLKSMYEIMSGIFEIGYDVFSLNFKGAKADYDKIKEQFKNFGKAQQQGIQEGAQEAVATAPGAAVDKKKSMWAGVNMEDKIKGKKEKGEKLADGMAGVAGGGGGVRNVTVSIGKMVGIETLSLQNLQQMSQDTIARIVQEVIVRAVRDSELLLGT